MQFSTLQAHHVGLLGNECSGVPVRPEQISQLLSAMPEMYTRGHQFMGIFVTIVNAALRDDSVLRD